MKLLIKSVISAALLFGTTPGFTYAGKSDRVDWSFDFNNGPQGWTHIFTDLPPEDDVPGGFFELDAGISPLPPELGVPGSGYLLSGNNHSDDLGMYLVRKFDRNDGIIPLQSYRAHIEVAFASNAPTGCLGAGGPPGEGVLLQLGLTPNPPTRIVDAENRLRLTNREARFEAGNIANGIPCPTDGSDAPYRLLTRSHDLIVEANAEGELWALVGTESGFESTTRLYYKSVQLQLTPHFGKD